MVILRRWQRRCDFFPSMASNTKTKVYLKREYTCLVYWEGIDLWKLTTMIEWETESILHELSE